MAGGTRAPRLTDGRGAGPARPPAAQGPTQTTPWAPTWVSGGCWAAAAPRPGRGGWDTHPCGTQGTEWTMAGGSSAVPWGCSHCSALPSPGWFMVTVSPPAKTTATAWLRSPVMREAAATCEIRAWYHLSGSGEGAMVGTGGPWGTGHGEWGQWGGMGPSAPTAGTEPPAPWGGSLPSHLPLPRSTSRAGGTRGSWLGDRGVLAGRPASPVCGPQSWQGSVCPQGGPGVPSATFWGSPQGSTRRRGWCCAWPWHTGTRWWGCGGAPSAVARAGTSWSPTRAEWRSSSR